MKTEKPDTYEEELRRAISRARRYFGEAEDGLTEPLADEEGQIPGCYWIKPAPTE